MLLLPLLFIFMHSIGFAAEVKKETQVGIAFADSQESTTFDLDKLKHFNTVKNIVEEVDFSEDQSIPLTNIKQNVFNCLVDLINQSIPKESSSKDSLLIVMRKLFTQTVESKYSKVNKLDLLLAANFLDPNEKVYPQKKFIKAVAALYADELKTRTISAKEEVPVELQPFVAGWLLHDLLQDKAIEPVSAKIALQKYIRSRSCSLADTGVAWFTKNSVFKNQDKHLELAYWNLHTNAVSNYTTSIVAPDNNTFATALSSDGTKCLVVCGNAGVGNPVFSIVDIITNTKTKNGLINAEPFDYVDAVYNPKDQCFIVLVEHWASKKIDLWSINLSGALIQDSFVSKDIQLSETELKNIEVITPSLGSPMVGDHGMLSNWRYSNNYLIRMRESNDFGHVSLIVYSLDKESIEFQGLRSDYEKEETKKFDFISYYFLNDGFNISQQCITHSFIPNYADIMSQRAKDSVIKTELTGAFNSHFDPVYMRYISTYMNPVGSNILKVNSLLPYSLSTAIRLLDQSYYAGNDLYFLAKAWLVYHAEKKTEQFKNFDDKDESFKKSLGDMKHIYSLPQKDQQPKGLMQKMQSLRQNIGSLWVKSKQSLSYNYYVYSGLLKGVAVAGGAAFIAWILAKKMNSALSSLQVPHVIHIKAGQSLQIRYTIFNFPEPGTFSIPGSNVRVIVAP